MAEPRWKTAFRAHIAPAHGACVHAKSLLAAALRALVSPQLLQDRDAAGRYVLLDFAMNNIDQAWICLSVSMDFMVASELVALRGCGPVPMLPVASVDLLRRGADADAHHDVWLALTRLQSAREYGQDTPGRTEAAYRHLCAARFMIAHLPPPAGPDAAMDQFHAAVGHIQSIEGSIVNMLSMITNAGRPPARIQWWR
uniref:Uncharacterized protein n=1 Tax=Avena sativa TaxID=4498 RepID=A0ACD5VFF3_AVESA